MVGEGKSRINKLTSWLDQLEGPVYIERGIQSQPTLRTLRSLRKIQII